MRARLLANGMKFIETMGLEETQRTIMGVHDEMKNTLWHEFMAKT